MKENGKTTGSNKTERQEKIETLGGYLALNRQIEADLAELGRLRKAATGIESRSHGRVTSAPVQTRLKATVEKIAWMQTRINREIDELVDVRLYLESRICALTDHRAALLLKYRYIDGKSWDEISELLYLQPESKQVYKLHNRALDDLRFDSKE